MCGAIPSMFGFGDGWAFREGQGFKKVECYSFLMLALEVSGGNFL